MPANNHPGGFRQRVEFPFGTATSDGGLVRVGDRMVPEAIDVDFPGVDGQPGLRMRIEVVGGVSQCRGVTLDAVVGGREVRRKDLDALDIAALVESISAKFSFEIVSEDGPIIAAQHTGSDDEFDSAVRTFHQARKGRGARKLDDAFKLKVARVYLANVEGNPTDAVARTFGVKGRTASGYVQQAAGAGYLSVTTPGKKHGPGPALPKED